MSIEVYLLNYETIKIRVDGETKQRQNKTIRE